MRYSSAAAWAYWWKSSTRRPGRSSQQDCSLLAVANREQSCCNGRLALRLVEPGAHLLEEDDGLGARDLHQVFPPPPMGPPALRLRGGGVERGPRDELPDEPL